MNIAVFGRILREDQKIYMEKLFARLALSKSKVYLFQPFSQYLSGVIPADLSVELFYHYEQIRSKVDIMFSIGGDGTLLDTMTLIRDSAIPVLGINLGRMGFISSVNKESIEQVVDEVIQGKYKIDKRSLLRLETDNDLFGKLNYALNDFTITSQNAPTLITLDVEVDGSHLNTYWADGLIVATPTGSTAYSLSCGGPILAPQSQNLIITPISSHNLTVRPVVIRDESIIKIKVGGRSSKFKVSLDSRIETIDSSITLRLRKEEFYINLVQMEQEDFFTTIREKLLWGLDIRNYN